LTLFGTNNTEIALPSILVNILALHQINLKSDWASLTYTYIKETERAEIKGLGGNKKTKHKHREFSSFYKNNRARRGNRNR